MKEKVTVGVLGCCVSRDNFNSMFNKKYSDISKCVIHQNQSSLLSVMSEAVSFDVAKINNLDKDFDRLHLISELDKSFLGGIVKEKPDYLIIDFFGDVLFGVFEYLGSYITNNTWKFPRTTFYKELESKKVISPLNDFDSYFKMWKNCIDDFFSFLKSNLPHTKVILNQARFADKYLDETTQEIKRFSTSGLVAQIDVDKYNFAWESFDEYVINNYDVSLIHFNKDSHLVDVNHPWNAYYVHYTKNYYSDFLIAFQNIVIKDYISEIINKENRISSREITLNQKDVEIKKMKKSLAFFENESFYHAVKRFLLKNDIIKKLNDFKNQRVTDTTP